MVESFFLSNFACVMLRQWPMQTVNWFLSQHRLYPESRSNVLCQSDSVELCTSCVLYCRSSRYYAASADLVVSTASKLADIEGCFSHQRSYKFVFQKTSLGSINVILLKFIFGKGFGRNFCFKVLLMSRHVFWFE